MWLCSAVKGICLCLHASSTLPQSWIIYGPGEIIKMDLQGNQFSCCVLNGGIEMKCRIIKKITSPPSHVIMSGSRGCGLRYSAGGSAFDLTERTPGPVQPTGTQWGGFTTHWGCIANCALWLFGDCVLVHPADHKQILLSEETGGLVAWMSKLEWLRAGMKVTGAAVWNMFHMDYNVQSVVGFWTKIKFILALHMNQHQNVPSAFCMQNCGLLFVDKFKW